VPDPEALSPLQRAAGEAILVRWPELGIEERPFVRKVAIRGRPDDRLFIAGIGRAFGVEPPRPGRAIEAIGATLLRVGPTEWLAVEQHAGPAPPREAEDALPSRLAAGLRTVDVSSATTIFRVSGPALDRTLRRVAAVRLENIAPGSVARMRMGRLPILVHAHRSDCLDLFVARSYARSFFEQLRDAADSS
jgi:heterotetrameric sarcosine oxidase gamma subunit